MSGAPSYPRFDRAATLLSSPARPAPHPLGCFRPPTEPAPSLPARPPRPPAPQGYTRSSHVTSAAYPRSGPDSYGSFTRESRPHEEHPLQPGGDRQAHAVQRAKLAAQAIRDPRYWTAEEVDAEAWKGKLGHWLAAERWARQHAGSGAADDGVTLVCCHANGCPKEGWEPTMRRLLDKGTFDPSAAFGDLGPGPPFKATSRPELRVAEVWMLDDAMQGASVDLNRGRLPGIRLWRDGARDVVNFIEHCLPHDEQGVHLEWHEARRPRRKIIGVGHSVGGSAILQAAVTRPDLFHSILLLEPICSPTSPIPNSLLLGAFKRRDTWPTLSAAMDSLRSSPFYGSWHPEQQTLLRDHGLVPLNGDSVQLATPSWVEGGIFAAIDALLDHWLMLPKLRIPVGFLVQDDPTGKMQSAMLGRAILQEMVWRPPRARNEIVPGGGHLIPQEKPDELAEAMWRFLGAVTSGRWDEGRPAAAKL